MARHGGRTPSSASLAETRLAAIDGLKRKYGGTAEEIFGFLEEARAHREVETAGERKLEKRVEAELATQAMERTRFQVSFDPASERGADAVRLVSPNLGEEPRPLEKVASGCEISRIALALKTCIAGGRPRTLVFG